MEMLMSLLPLVIVFGVFWFMFIRPQRQRQQEYEDMLSNLERGDRVYTRGGIKGLITKVEEDGIELRIAPEVNVELKRNGIAELVEKANQPSSEETEAEADQEEETEDNSAEESE